MVITDDFVYVHYPKTGGTFVTHALKQLYESRAIDVFKHGTCRDIPAEHRSKPIVSTIRHPLSRWVSAYEFGWWKRHVKEEFEFWELSDLHKLYPHFPALTFTEYVELWNEHWLPQKLSSLPLPTLDHIGTETFDFVTFFSRDPSATLVSIAADDNDDLSSVRLSSDMYDIHFMRTDELNRDLHTYLSRLGWERSAIDFIIDAPRICPEEPTRTTGRSWETYYSEPLKDTIRSKERFVFETLHELRGWR